MAGRNNAFGFGGGFSLMDVCLLYQVTLDFRGYNEVLVI
jgi:hypothetical protein